MEFHQFSSIIEIRSIPRLLNNLCCFHRQIYLYFESAMNSGWNGVFNSSEFRLRFFSETSRVEKVTFPNLIEIDIIRCQIWRWFWLSGRFCFYSSLNRDFGERVEFCNKWNSITNDVFKIFFRCHCLYKKHELIFWKFVENCATFV